MPRPAYVYASTQKGHRPTNEDYESYSLNLATTGDPVDPTNGGPVDFFAICDGHGGKEVADFVGPLLEEEFTKKTIRYPLKDSTVINIFDHIQNKLASREDSVGDECGCTALVLVRYWKDEQEFIQVANIGDCRAVVSVGGFSKQITRDHKPSCPDETSRINKIINKTGTRERIVHCEGDWRICGLSVCRAFGDINQTPYITHCPDIYTQSLGKKDEFIILACDGLWDVLSNQEAVNFVRDHFTNNNIDAYRIRGAYPPAKENNPKNVATKLAKYAIARGSGDNVSVIIIRFA